MPPTVLGQFTPLKGGVGEKTALKGTSLSRTKTSETRTMSLFVALVLVCLSTTHLLHRQISRFPSFLYPSLLPFPSLTFRGLVHKQVPYQ